MNSSITLGIFKPTHSRFYLLFCPEWHGYGYRIEGQVQIRLYASRKQDGPAYRDLLKAWAELRHHESLIIEKYETYLRHEKQAVFDLLARFVPVKDLGVIVCNLIWPYFWPEHDLTIEN